MDFAPATQSVVSGVLEVWPEHEKFIQRGIGSLSAQTLDLVENIAASLLAVVGNDLTDFASDYKVMCRNLNDEEFYFRRNDAYRFATYEEVADFVYHNSEYMQTYMRGLLVSQVLWTNHVEVMSFYQSNFLNTLPPSGRHVEIGPGHGLFMHMALQAQKFDHCEGWDISESSLRETEATLRALGHSQGRYTLKNKNALEIGSDGALVDALTISEVLEHTEQPQEILDGIYQNLAVSGKVFVNVPLNCPAIDHIYLYRDVSEIVAQVEASGFRVEDVHEAPVTGFTLERAKRMKATISVAIIGAKAS